MQKQKQESNCLFYEARCQRDLKKIVMTPWSPNFHEKETLFRLTGNRLVTISKKLISRCKRFSIFDMTSILIYKPC